MRPNLVNASFALYGLKSWPRSTPQDRICEMLYFSYLQSVSDLSRVFPLKSTHFEREGLKPLLATIKH